MKILITGGGTGGHVYPGIGIAEKFLAGEGENEVLFVGTAKGLESKIIPQHGYNIEFIKARGIDRRSLKNNIGFTKDYFEGRKKAMEIIKSFSPDVVIGTGGYVSGPVIGAAAKLKIPVYIQEQNVFPGLTNRVLSGKATKVFLGFKGAMKYFKENKKVVVSGNPITSKFENLDKENSRKKIGVKKESFVITIFGGSLGAGKINEYALKLIEEYYGSKKVEIVLITGLDYLDDIKTQVEKIVEKKGKEKTNNIYLLDYVYDMENYMESADLVIGRSGALTVSELLFLGKPSIFIPSPNVTKNHQFFNAEEAADKGPAIVIEEKDIEGLLDVVKDLIDNKQMYEELVEKGKLQKGLNGSEIIVEIIKNNLKNSN